MINATQVSCFGVYTNNWDQTGQKKYNCADGFVFASQIGISSKSVTQGVRVNEFILHPAFFPFSFCFQNKVSLQSNLFTVCEINFAPLQIELEFPVGRSIMVGMMQTPQREGKREEKTGVRAVRGI